MNSTLQWVLAVLKMVPWELVLTVVVVPLLMSWSKKIKDEKLREVYVELVQWAEQALKDNTGAAKKAAVLGKVSALGLPVSETKLEAAVYAATKKPPGSAAA